MRPKEIDLKDLAMLIEGMEFDWYVGIATGGIPIMYALAQCTRMKNLDVYVPWQDKHFQHLTKQKVLLVDDVVETGKTMMIAVAVLETWKPKSLNTIALSESFTSVFSPDYCLVRNAEEALRARIEFVEKEIMSGHVTP